VEARGIEPEPYFPDVRFHTAPNWTAVGFLALLAFLHGSVAVPALIVGRWEGYLSLLFAALFSIAAAVVYHVRREVMVLPRTRFVQVRTGVGMLRCERRVPFGRVRTVRVTLGPRESVDDSVVELLCQDHDDIECPPTLVPRQEGLLLAIMLNVPLVVASDGPRARTVDVDGRLPDSRVAGARGDW
jgi:hypothetical protein